MILFLSTETGAPTMSACPQALDEQIQSATKGAYDRMQHTVFLKRSLDEIARQYNDDVREWTDWRTKMLALYVPSDDPVPQYLQAPEVVCAACLAVLVLCAIVYAKDYPLENGGTVRCSPIMYYIQHADSTAAAVEPHVRQALVFTVALTLPMFVLFTITMACMGRRLMGGLGAASTT